jgi:hypothetical protein
MMWHGEDDAAQRGEKIVVSTKIRPNHRLHIYPAPQPANSEACISRWQPPLSHPSHPDATVWSVASMILVVAPQFARSDD